MNSLCKKKAMKNALFIMSLLALLYACGDSKTNTGADENKKPVSTDVYRGKMLISQNDCLTCHREDTTLVGPSYSAVAEKYAAQSNVPDTLAQKIIKGGSGNWGEAVMTPHPNLSEADAKLMVAYIMSLN